MPRFIRFADDAWLLGPFPKGMPVRAASGEEGHTTGTFRACQLEGCTGTRVGVRWPDGKLTWPCTKGMRRVAAGVAAFL